MNSKPKKHAEYTQVVYTRTHWSLLDSLRKKAEKIMTALENFHLHPLVHGSIARGDVTKKSDIDLFIFGQHSSFLLETALERADIPVNARFLIQATPNYVMKAYIELDFGVSISFPLMRLRKVEREFYKFGGEQYLKQLKTGARIAGVNKSLMLIEPTSIGHSESSIIGRENIVAKLLGVSTETVLDRVHTLLKRDEIGRTGVFIKQELGANETFEMALKRLIDKNSIVRRRMKTYSG